jgi:hypothetical protein
VCKPVLDLNPVALGYPAMRHNHSVVSRVDDLVGYDLMVSNWLCMSAKTRMNSFHPCTGAVT